MFSRDLLVALQHNFYIPFISKCRPVSYLSSTEILERELFKIHYQTISRAVNNRPYSKIDLIQSVTYFEKFIKKGSLKTAVLGRNAFKPTPTKVFTDFGIGSTEKDDDTNLQCKEEKKVYVGPEKMNDKMDELTDLFSSFSSKIVSNLGNDDEILIKEEKYCSDTQVNVGSLVSSITKIQPIKEIYFCERGAKIEPKYYTRYQARLATQPRHRIF
jgi:hypothetical protein